MPHHIFFSWQLDTQTATGRNLIARALETAVAAVAEDADVDPADRELAVDSDSAGVPGSPPIVETIFSKIDRAAAFVSDMTYVAQRADGRRMPNPNVLLEHGWALRALSWRGVISVMNTAHGHPDDHPLPFDLAHFRRPIFFDCPDDADIETKRTARQALTNQFTRALRAILDDQVLRQARVPVPPAEPHPHDVALLDRVRRQLPESFQLFLRQHSFGEPFRRHILAPMYDISEDWHGAAFEFHDPVLQAPFADLLRLVGELASLTLARLYIMRNDIELLSPKTDMDLAQGTQSGTVEAVVAMNAKATEVSAAIDVFERTARDRIRVTAQPAPDTAAETSRSAHAMIEELALDRQRGQVPVIVSKPSVTIRVVPMAATERKRLDLKAVGNARLRFPPDPNVRVETGSDGRQWWSNDPPRNVGAPNPASRWLTRIVRPGIVEHQQTIGFRIDNDREILIDGHRLEATIVAAIDRIAQALAQIDLGGGALVSISFDGTEDVILERGRPGGHKVRQPQFALPVIQLDDLQGNVSAALHEPFDILWNTSGWEDGSPNFGTGEWRTGGEPL